MLRRPTFDEIAYAPDDSECPTLEQAWVPLACVQSAAEVLAQQVVNELTWRDISVVNADHPLTMWTPAELITSHGRNPDLDWLCVGTVPYRKNVTAPPLESAFGNRVGMAVVRAGVEGRLVADQPGGGLGSLDGGPYLLVFAAPKPRRKGAR